MSAPSASLEGSSAPNVLPGTSAAYLADATEARGLAGHAEAVALPATLQEVAAVVAWCYERDLLIVPRGGGTGFAGGAVPRGGVVVATDRLTHVRSFEPLLWRMEVEAGVRTADVRGLARELGHAGDGNLHSTFLVARESAADVAAAEGAAIELFELVVRLGGAISGEHGLGLVKQGRDQWSPRVRELHAALKSAFDPKHLMNPGKKL